MTRGALCLSCLAALSLPVAARGQSLGTFRWQLQPFCNVLAVDVTQQGMVYTIDGYDSQCGAGQRAPLVGLATPNPDGSIGLGLHLVTVPGGRGLCRTGVLALLRALDHVARLNGLDGGTGPAADRGLVRRVWSWLRAWQHGPITERIETFAADGKCDFIEQFAKVFPTQVFLRIVGLPMEHTEMFMAWVEATFDGLGHFGDKAVRVVGPDTPYAQAGQAGT